MKLELVFILVFLFLGEIHESFAQINKNDLQLKQKELLSSQKKNDTIIFLTNLLSDVINSSHNKLVPIKDIIYDAKETDGGFIKFCYLKYDTIILVLQQEKDKRLMLIDSQYIQLNDVIINKSCDAYPFEITGDIDCFSSRFYIVKKCDKLFIFIETVPENWTGLMVSEYLFYILIDPFSKIGVQTVAKN